MAWKRSTVRTRPGPPKPIDSSQRYCHCKYKSMRLWLAAILGTSLLSAADEQRVVLALKAQTEFIRVETAAAMRLAETQGCVQAQAAFLPVAGREEVAEVHYRKGFCLLAGASLTGNAGEYSESAAALERAIESWSASSAAGAKNRPAKPI